MRRPTCRARLISALTGIAAMLTWACAPGVRSGPFKEVNRLERTLQRGVSTMADVKRELGPPNGTGGAVLPVDSKPREVWFYQDVEMTSARGWTSKVLQLQLRTQILLVFFKNGLFDGFMWFSSAVTGTAGP